MMKKACFALAALSVFAMGCEPKAVKGTRVGAGSIRQDLSGNGIDTVVEYFEPKDLALNDAQMFMWRPDPLSADDVAQVIDLADRLEKAKDQSFVLRPQVKALTDVLDPVAVEQGIDGVAEYVRQLNDVLPEQERKLAKAQGELTTEQAVLKGLHEELEKQPPAVGEPGVVAPEVLELQKKIEASEKKIAKAQQQIQKCNDKIEPILKVRDLLAAEHAAEFADWTVLANELQVNMASANDYLGQINSIAWVFNSSPIQMSFTFVKKADGNADWGAPISAKIHNWDLAKIDDPVLAEVGVPNDDITTEGFGSAQSWIENVSYDTRGGIFTFEVHTPGAQFWFKLTRNKYHALDKRIHYKGDILRCSVEGGSGRPVIRDTILGEKVCGVDGEGKSVYRRGAANLVDQDDKS